MLVIHSIERLETYMLTALIIWSVMICLILLLVFGLLAYDCIYDYVSEQLDKCTYFGEDNGETIFKS